MSSFRLITACVSLTVCLLVSCEQPKRTPGEVSNIGKNHKVEVLIFSAKWCGACKKVPPVIKDLKPEFPYVEFRTLDTDDSENAQLANQYNVSAIPHFVLRVDGDSVGSFKGAKSADYIAEFIKLRVAE